MSRGSELWTSALVVNCLTATMFGMTVVRFCMVFFLALYIADYDSFNQFKPQPVITRFGKAMFFVFIPTVLYFRSAIACELEAVRILIQARHFRLHCSGMETAIRRKTLVALLHQRCKNSQANVNSESGVPVFQVLFMTFGVLTEYLIPAVNVNGTHLHKLYKTVLFPTCVMEIMAYLFAYWCLHEANQLERILIKPF